MFHRKDSAKIRVFGKDGKPAANTKFHINQINHEFLFGCGAFEALPLTHGQAVHNGTGAPLPVGPDGKQFTEEELKAQQARLEERMNKWLDLFNYGTLPFYWGGYEPEEGKPHTAQLMAAAKFLKSHDVKVKGHPLCWHTGCAPWLLKYDNKTIIQKQLERIHRDVGNFKGVIDMWDVINEVVIMPVYDKYDNAITRICKELGQVGIVKKVFDAAQETNPDGVFLINDFNMSEKYEQLIADCLEAGAPIKTIGLQSHQHQGVWTLEKTEEILARFEHFGLPIHFTENTIVAGPLVAPEITDLQDAHYDDDAATPELEQKQADDLTKMYRNLFENHPLVTAITNWDFGDGAWLNAPSGVIRKDNSLKPSYTALHHLIKEEWHTELDATSDANGFITIEGYKGKYEISAGGENVAERTGSAIFNLKTGGDLQLR